MKAIKHVCSLPQAAAVTHSVKDKAHKAERRMQMYICICERSKGGDTDRQEDRNHVY